jgi:hypothetical protein
MENGILLPSLRPMLPLLDLHDIRRLDFHNSILDVGYQKNKFTWSKLTSFSGITRKVDQPNKRNRKERGQGERQKAERTACQKLSSDQSKIPSTHGYVHSQ